MSEWWTYTLSDLLMFSARTYFRLFALHNEAVWPAHLAAIAAGLVLVGCVLRGAGRAGRLAAALLALAWLWVAWAYHAQRYADINLAAPFFAIGFALQAVLLAWLATRHRAPAIVSWRSPLGAFAFALVLLALLLYPLFALIEEHGWRQAEVFGIAPDPTVAATLGMLLLWRAPWFLWPLPLLWCAVSGATLNELGVAQAWVLPAAGVLALAAGIAAHRGLREARA
ncbi:DUF6064 family protein [Massilia haematophila]|uniref:DUF6064 family protein n=1 Tax=Massilia haematophila TaxID=457923 RepID=A0ABV7PP96_9BURK